MTARFLTGLSLVLTMALTMVLITACTPVPSLNASWADQMIEDGGIVGVSNTPTNVTAYVQLNEEFYQTVQHGCEVPMNQHSEYVIVAVPETVDDLGNLRFNIENCAIDTSLEQLNTLLAATMEMSTTMELAENQQLSLVRQSSEDWNLVVYESISNPVYSQNVSFESILSFYERLGDEDMSGYVRLSTHEVNVMLPLSLDSRTGVKELLVLAKTYPQDIKALGVDEQTGQFVIEVGSNAPLLLVDTSFNVMIAS